MNEASYPSRQADQYVVRFPDGLRDQIKALAKTNRRSMNAEIIVALEARMQAATGEGFADTAPAAAEKNAALQGGLPITNGKGRTDDEYSD